MVSVGLVLQAGGSSDSVPAAAEIRSAPPSPPHLNVESLSSSSSCASVSRSPPPHATPVAAAIAIAILSQHN